MREKIVKMIDYQSGPTDDQTILQSYFRQSIISFSKENLLFVQGDAISGIYYLLEGIVKVQQINAGETFTLYLADKGDFLGINDFFQKDSKHSISAIALSEGKAGFLSSDLYFRMINQNPGVGFEILSQMNKQIGLIEKQLSDIHSHDAYRTIKAFVFYLAESFGVDKDRYLNIPLSPEDIADLSGVSKTYMRKLLPSFRTNGIFESKKRRIRLLTSKKLQ